MPIDEAKIARMEEELAKARAELLTEDGRRYRALRDLLGMEEIRRLADGLKDREHRILFGLEVPDEPKARCRRKEEGTIECPICHRKFKNERGLKIHMGREHPEQAKQPEPASGPSAGAER